MLGNLGILEDPGTRYQDTRKVGPARIREGQGHQIGFRNTGALTMRLGFVGCITRHYKWIGTIRDTLEVPTEGRIDPKP